MNKKDHCNNIDFSNSEKLTYLETIYTFYKILLYDFAFDYIGSTHNDTYSSLVSAIEVAEEIIRKFIESGTCNRKVFLEMLLFLDGLKELRQEEPSLQRYKESVASLLGVNFRKHLNKFLKEKMAIEEKRVKDFLSDNKDKKPHSPDMILLEEELQKCDYAELRRLFTAQNVEDSWEPKYKIIALKGLSGETFNKIFALIGQEEKNNIERQGIKYVILDCMEEFPALELRKIEEAQVVLLNLLYRIRREKKGEML